MALLAHRMYCLKHLNNAEAATGGAMLEKVFLEISQNSQENTCASVSLIKLEALACNFIKKKDSGTGVFL